MNFINTLGFITISFLLVRVIILIKIDSHRKKNTFLKFLFGAYALEAMIPIIRKPDSEEEAKLVKAANICLVVFYVLFVTVLLIVWFKYHDPNIPIPNDNKTNQAMLGINNKEAVQLPPTLAQVCSHALCGWVLVPNPGASMQSCFVRMGTCALL